MPPLKFTKRLLLGQARNQYQDYNTWDNSKVVNNQFGVPLLFFLTYHTEYQWKKSCCRKNQKFSKNIIPSGIMFMFMFMYYLYNVPCFYRSHSRSIYTKSRYHCANLFYAYIIAVASILNILICIHYSLSQYSQYTSSPNQHDTYHCISSKPLSEFTNRVGSPYLTYQLTNRALYYKYATGRRHY